MYPLIIMKSKLCPLLWVWIAFLNLHIERQLKKVNSHCHKSSQTQSHNTSLCFHRKQTLCPEEQPLPWPLGFQPMMCQNLQLLRHPETSNRLLHYKVPDDVEYWNTQSQMMKHTFNIIELWNFTGEKRQCWRKQKKSLTSTVQLFYRW